MPKRAATPTSPRKQPRQARSVELVAAILKAAIRVLEREGAARFTTIRVAAEAGVSVGSLYQYFPNKQAILYQLQVEEWQATGAALEAILGDGARSVEHRLRAAMRAFFRSECDEAPLRRALDAAAPVYLDAPEARLGRRRSQRIAAAFVRSAAPQASPKQRALAAELMMVTMFAVGKEVSERRRTRVAVDAWADAVATMLLGYLRAL